MKYPSDWDTSLSKKPICGVLAVAVCANVTFERATQAIKNNLMPWQKRHGGRTYNEQVIASVRELGCQVIEHPARAKMNLSKWHANYAMPGVLYLVKTSGHFVTIFNGYCIDQYEIKHIEEYHMRRCFVVNVTEIY